MIISGNVETKLAGGSWLTVPLYEPCLGAMSRIGSDGEIVVRRASKIVPRRFTGGFITRRSDRARELFMQESV